MKTLTIRNVANPPRPLTLNLPAVIVPEAAVHPRAARTAASGPAPLAKTGGAPKRIAPIETRSGGSITLLARGSTRNVGARLPDGTFKTEAADVVKGVPFSAKRAPDVIAAEARGDIKIDVVIYADAPGAKPAVPRRAPNPANELPPKRAEIKVDKSAAKPVVKEG